MAESLSGGGPIARWLMVGGREGELMGEKERGERMGFDGTESGLGWDVVKGAAGSGQVSGADWNRSGVEVVA